ncbi:outer membrane beta-barrel family protein [Chitinophaga filiformis]|uniref:outer membrane beta-barrel protein n=1 Tax=Chitinophaga filiformis TaxID=104663 RepID=UPI001F1AE7DE|nr:outer membrane beta-barrel protein [Chitinophaga filiformis]MCF6405925.1 outer membrane beta-barrel family protein [Chitinophaga filiformis]
MRNFTVIISALLLFTARLSAQTKNTVRTDTSKPKIRDLKEVVVESRPPIRMKGDTVEYNAAQYKTKENAVVEDLLRKLPGVKVDQGGNITAQGEKVAKVLVDGKEFFGNDPAIATKNLPADMVAKVQVLDKMSDQEEFTGIDDGDKVKTINIVTKKNSKKGYFGNISAGIGPDGKYDGGLNINSFAGEQQLSLLFKANNVNKSGFSASELIRMLSANPELFNNLPAAAIAELSKMKGVRINSDDPAEKAQLARPTGINNTQYGGVNYNNDWGEALKLRSSYFFNRFTSRNSFNYDRHYLLADTAYNYLQNGISLQENNNHRGNAAFDIRLDKYNSLKISPAVNHNTSVLKSNRTYRSYTADNTLLLNQGEQVLNGNNTNTNATADILYRHRFAKPGRTLSLVVTPEYLRVENQSLNIARNEYYNLGTTDSINQQTQGHSDNYSLNNNLIYTEQLTKHTALRLTEQFNINQGDYEQLAYNMNHADGAYNVLDDRYSDIYNSTITRNIADVAIAGRYKKFNYTAGLSIENSRLKGNSDYKTYRLSGNYNTVLPHVYARYRFSKSKQLTLNYNSNAVLPGLNQLRPLEDISDPLYIRKGNPDLQQAVNHDMTLAYLSNNIYSNVFTNIQLRISAVRNQFTDYYTIDSAGRQLISPINANGYFSGSLHGERSVPFGGNGSSLTFGAELSYNRYPGYFNAIADKIRQWGITPDFNFNYYPISDLSMTFRGNASWNDRHSEANPGTNQQYWFLNYGLDLMANLPWKLNADAGIECYTTTGLSGAYNNTVALLSGGLSRDINKQFSLRLEGYDLLNQNKSFNRLARNGYTEDRQNNVLGRYYMLSLICKLRHFAKNNQ